MKRRALLVVFGIVFLLTGCTNPAGNNVNTGNESSSESVIEQSELQLETSSVSDEENTTTKWDEVWYATRNYPVKWGEEEFTNMSWEEITAALNPPADLLAEMTTEELADLTLRYPMYFDIPHIDDTQAGFALSNYAGRSRIYEEILNRDGHVDAILEAYRNLELNLNFSEMNTNTDESWLAELFIEEFVLVNGKDFTDQQRSLYLDIVQERTEKYYSKIEDCRLGRIAFNRAKTPYRKYYFYNVELPNRHGGGLMTSPYIEYEAFLHGVRNAVFIYNPDEKINISNIVIQGFKFECTMLDLDGDEVDEMLIQAVGSPENYNGVFHCEDGQVICWNHDTCEGSSRAYPLKDGTMVRQYDTNGATSYTLFKYLPTGEMNEIGTLFVRHELIPEDSTEPCPYYNVNGKEVTQAEFEDALESMVTSSVLDQSAWCPFKK